MGKVYYAVDELSNEQPVAVKVIPEGEIRPGLNKLLMNEFKFLKTLSHENICRVFDFGFVEGSSTCFFTSEYVEGLDLYRFAKQHSVSEVIDVVVQICRALSYIHSRGVIHSDIKHSNILVAGRDGKFVPKVMDFGISAYTVSSSRGVLRGTTSFIAPELIAGQEIDHRIDLYSLGITLYGIVYRKKPFDATDEKELFDMILHRNITFSEQTTYPWGFIEIIMRLVEKRPWNRYATANEIISDINHKLNLTYSVETNVTKKSYVSTVGLLERKDVLAPIGAIIRTLAGGQLHTSSSILIKGGKGCGKTRLLDRIKLEAQLTGIYAIFIDAAVHGSDFSLLATLCRHLRAIDRDDSPIEEQFDRLKGGTLEGDSDTVRAALNMRKYGLFKTVSDYATRCALKKPILLLIDDFHLLDKASAEFVSHVIADLKYVSKQGTPQLSIVVSAPVSEKEKPDWETHFDSIFVLQNFEHKETVRELVKAAFDLQKVPDSFVSQLYDITHGNPLLIMEFLGLLLEKGLIILGSDREISSNINLDAIEAPHSLEAIYANQTTRLSELEHELLRFIACFPEGCPLEIAFDALKTDAEIMAYYSFLRERVLVEDRRKRLVLFVDAGFRKALNSNMTREEKARVHGLIMTILEQAKTNTAAEEDTASGMDLISQCAYHSQFIGDPAKTIQYNMLAAEKTTRSGSFYQAIDHYETCLRMRPHLDEPTHNKVLWNLVNLKSLVGDYTAAIEHCADIVRRSFSASALAREASIRLATLHKDLGRHDASLAILDTLENPAVNRPLSDYDLCRIYNLRGTCLLSQSKYVDVTTYSGQVLSMVPDSQHDPRYIREKIRAISNIAQVNSFLGNYTRAIELLEQALAISDPGIHAPERLQILSRLGYAHSVASHVDRSFWYYQEGYSFAQKIHSLRGQSILANNLANSYLKLGQIENALNYFEEAHKTAIKMNSLSEEAFCKTSLGNLYRLLGLNKSAEKDLADCYAMALQNGWMKLENLTSHFLALLFLETGNPEEAHNWLRRLTESYEKTGVTDTQAIMLGLIEMRIQVEKKSYLTGRRIGTKLFEMIEKANDMRALDRYYLILARLVIQEADDYPVAHSYLRKALNMYQLFRGDSSNIEHLDILLHIHFELAMCANRLLLNGERKEHSATCIEVIAKMLRQIPQKYHDSFFSYNRRGHIQTEARKLIENEVTSPRFK